MDRQSLREALVVGINSYPFLKKKKLGDLNLKAAIKDAEAIANMLEKYGKFRVQRLPKGYDEEGKERFEPRGTVRIDELKQAIINLFQPPIKNETPDVALLFFAGHGFVNTKGDIREGVLVTSEAQFLENISENDNISGISLSWLKEFLQDSLVKKQIVWLDCCFSGELLNFDGVANPNTQEKQVSRCFITASRSFQTATEKIDGKQGLFTDNLLECLNPENYGNGWVTNHILTESIQERMSQTSQAPMCYNSGSTIILTTNSLTEPLDERWKNVPPYRGLSYFGQQENDGVFFHGRTGLTDKLIEQVKNHNFVAVLGASGSGKSSLLRAGLLYQLKRGQEISGSDRWLCIDPFTPEEFPLKSLLKSLGKSLLEIKIKGEKVESLIQFIHQIEGKKVEFLTKELIEEKLIEFIDMVEAERVIMVMDQFEESFTLCKTHEERREFFDCFLAVLERRGEKFCVVLGIRADFLGRCSEYGGLANKIQGHQLLVTPLDEDEIEEVIKKPAALVAMDVEPKLVAQMREDFLRNPGSLPLLEYTLDALWKFATQGEEKSQYLTLETYTNLGGIEGTLTKRADAVFDSLSEEEKSVAQRIFLELVQPGEGEISSGKITDTRRRVILEKLPNERHSLELLSAVTDKLADKNNRLITKDKSEAGILLDIVHEDLIRSWKTLRKWVEEYQEALPVERKIEADAAEWEKDGKSENLLLRAGRLTKAEEYLRIYGEMALLDGLAYEFIEASRERRERELEQEKKARKSAQIRNQILVIFSVLMTGVSGYAWMQQKIAKHNSEIFFARQLAAKAELLSTNNFYDTSVLLGVQSMKKIQELKECRDSWWQKVVRKFLGSQFSDLAQNAADRSIRKGLTQLPDHLHTLHHQDDVNAVAFSPDGKTIATASDDKTARLWNTENGNELATLYHKGNVNAIAFSPDSKTIATANGDGTARLWDGDTGEQLATFPHKDWLKALAFSPDDQTIATASGYTAYLWDTETGKKLAIFSHQETLTAVAFSPDGKTIATASEDGIVRLWDKETGKELATFSHQGTVNVNAVAFSPDGKTIATASNDYAAVSASDNYTARLWDIDTGKELAIFRHDGSVIGVAFSPNGQTIATTSDDNTARLWDTENGNELATLNHEDTVRAVAFSPEGKTIATASDDNTVLLWDKNTSQELATFNHELWLVAVTFSPDGKTIATASSDNTVRLWDIDTGKKLATFIHEDSAIALAFSPDGKTIVTGSDDNTARLWDIDTGKELATLNHQEWVRVVAFSPDGKTIATGSYDDAVRIWDTDTGKELATLNHQDDVNAVTFSPDGKTIVTGSDDNTARLWDIDTGKELATLNHQGWVIAVAFSPDGKTIATASEDKSARLWDTKNGNELVTLNHQHSVRAVAFSPDGRTITTASYDHTARLWDTRNGNELATLNHQAMVKAATFSPDGKTIATASNDKTARLWDTKNGNELTTLNHQARVFAVAFSPDGKTIATASDDKTARLHWATPEGLIQEACRRLSRNLTAEEWQQYINSDLETYQKTCDELPVHPSVM